MAMKALIGSWLSEIFNPIATAGRETAVLAPRTLRIVRAGVMAVFATALFVYSFDLFALWDESHARQFSTVPNEYGESTTFNYFGLTPEEQALAGGSIGETPGWYPIFVIGRQVVLELLAIGIAWLIFSRRPKHGMAYLTTLFILLGPWLSLPGAATNRLEGSVMFWPAEILGILGVVVFLSFLWLFPDGRFRGALIRLVVSVVGVVIVVLAAGEAIRVFVSIPQTVEDIVGSILFLGVLASVLFWAVMGISLQVWRYKNTMLGDRRLARWNLALLVAIPLWTAPFEGLHELFSDTDVGRYSLSGFVWEQTHETLDLAAPAAFGIWMLFLIRRQGWWDFQTLWNRTAVYGIGLLMLGALYGAALGLVTLIASPLADTGEQIVAVLAATAAVAFAYGPLLGGVRRWVDDRWFPKRAEVDAVSRSFADELRLTSSPESVPDHLLAVVQTHLDPEHVEFWTVGGGEVR
jgi:hypothetical protein